MYVTDLCEGSALNPKVAFLCELNDTAKHFSFYLVCNCLEFTRLYETTHESIICINANPAQIITIELTGRSHGTYMARALYPGAWGRARPM